MKELGISESDNSQTTAMAIRGSKDPNGQSMEVKENTKTTKQAEMEKKKGKAKVIDSGEDCLSQPMKRIVMTFKDKQDDADFIFQMLLKANEKDYGNRVTPHDLLMMGVRALTDKHIEKLKECSLTSRQRTERAYAEAVKNEKYKGSLDDFMWANSKLNKGEKYV
jgi:hypothetical protein